MERVLAGRDSFFSFESFSKRAEPPLTRQIFFFRVPREIFFFARKKKLEDRRLGFFFFKSTRMADQHRDIIMCIHGQESTRHTWEALAELVPTIVSLDLTNHGSNPLGDHVTFLFRYTTV